MVINEEENDEADENEISYEEGNADNSHHSGYKRKLSSRDDEDDEQHDLLVAKIKQLKDSLGNAEFGNLIAKNLPMTSLVMNANVSHNIIDNVVFKTSLNFT